MMGDSFLNEEMREEQWKCCSSLWVALDVGMQNSCAERQQAGGSIKDSVKSSSARSDTRDPINNIVRHEHPPSKLPKLLLVSTLVAISASFHY